jgi:hypothetical protein
VTVAGSSSAGALVTYSDPATHDLVSGVGAATCSPASGSQFPVGTTLVVCNATDAAHNPAAPTSFNVIVTFTSPESSLSRFVVFSRDLTWLRALTTVVSGDVGANQRRLGTHAGDSEGDDGGRSDVTVRVGIGVTMQEKQSRVVGDSVLLLPLSSVANVVDNTLTKRALAKVRGTVTTPMALPFTTLPSFPSITPGAQNITVGKNQKMTLAAGRYAAVKVATGATLVLTGGLYEINTLALDPSATVLFKAATQLRIQTELGSGHKARLILDPSVAGLRASQMMIYVGGADPEASAAQADDDGDNGGPVSVHLGTQNVVQANIYAGNGTIWLKSMTQATGAFIGLHVRVGIGVRLTLDSGF